MNVLRHKFRFSSGFLACLLLVTSFFYTSCGSQSEPPAETDLQSIPDTENIVQIQPLEKQPFRKQLVSNGKLKAVRKSDLKFQTEGIILELPVKNGSYLQKGALIARLDNEKQQQNLKHAQLELEKAKLELQDYRLGRSVKLEGVTDSARNAIALIQSGVAAAQIRLDQARQELTGTVLRAPFAGRIANLELKQYDKASPGEVFCTLIDDARFEVEFKVLETELQEIALGKQIQVLPLFDTIQSTGKVTEINPFVDEFGMVTVRAILNNQGRLLDGMNTRVIVENEVPDQLVVPRSAVVLRQNQEVLFKYQDGIAFWTYVLTTHESGDNYAVIAHPDKSGSLEAGDTVIISGNLNLAHESPVVYKQ